MSLKSIRNMEETIPLKSLFDSSWYLERLSRYKDSKGHDAPCKDREWISSEPLTYTFSQKLYTTFF